MTNKIAVAAATLGMLGSPAGATNIEILEPASRKTVVASKDQFTGTVLVEALFPANEQNGHSTGHVTFTPGARTAWHSHPKGQLLIITDGGPAGFRSTVRKSVRSKRATLCGSPRMSATGTGRPTRR